MVAVMSGGEFLVHKISNIGRKWHNQIWILLMVE